MGRLSAGVRTRWARLTPRRRLQCGVRRVFAFVWDPQRSDGVCWGGNSDGQADAPEGKFTAVSPGDAHSCGIRTDWTVVCWGGRRDGQVDAPEGKFRAVSAGNGYSCGVRSDGTAVCWGENWWGRADAPWGKFIAVSAGETHSCGVRSDGTVACWGENIDGRSDPPEGQFSAVSAGEFHSCGFAAMGRLPAGERTSMVDRRLRKENSGWCRRGVGIRVESVPMRPLPAGLWGREGGVLTHRTERL